jgi:hypothetical protein
MKKAFKISGQVRSNKKLFKQFEEDISRILESEKVLILEDQCDAEDQKYKKDIIPLRFLTKTQFWLNGGIVGSKKFVLQFAALFNDKDLVKKKKLCWGKTLYDEPICCFINIRN